MLKKEYKLVVIKIIKLVFIILIVDFSLGYISKQLFYSQKTGKYARSTYAIKKTEAEILIFGSSHAHRHYIPEIFEKELQQRCYNAGAEGQQLLYHSSLQKMILKRYTPQIMILNIDADFLYQFEESYSRLSDLHPYYTEYSEELKPTLELRSRFVDVKLFFNSYQVNSTIMHIIRYGISAQVDDMGYRPLFGVMNNDDNDEKEEELGIINEIDINFEKALLIFIENTKQNNIKLYFVTSPTYKLKDHSKNKSFNRIKQIVKDEEIPFIDLSNDPRFISKGELFHDVSHLNKKGAILFTQYVINDIKQSLNDE